ncbi:aminotransferase class I/II-fold pyridoxal phosphate-dependent enzyme [Actinomadura chibensis]|uniref:Aminotransferase class I/II-fold pyridoxal phosphate-dependent enzyme n=1 Tax=Actinomadura chibensis TaxID=392828 RepID=A0A5D0NM05_9ACTN|nr:aminotransferase class I/II-fold pyridoxal phosphate-dependent enzyme [Actinomadura chibensis]
MRETSASPSPVPRPLVDSLPSYSRAASASIRWRASSNEAPIPPSPLAVRAAADAAAKAHLYPSLGGEGLIEALADHVGIAPDRVAVGPGSLALLERLLLAYTGAGTEVVHAWRSYEAYPIVVTIAGARSVAVPLDAFQRHDVDAMLRSITGRTRVLIICDPNNPTGTILDPAEVERLVRSVPSDVLVVIDEAYREFDENAPDTLGLLTLPNVALLRTFSKAYGLAGLRAGYLLAAPQICRTIQKVALPFALSRIAEAAATAALADDDHLRSVVQTVRTRREQLAAKLSTVADVPQSRANFLWIPIGARAASVAAACAKAGLSVRSFPGEGVRVTVGDPNVDDILLKSLHPTP